MGYRKILEGQYRTILSNMGWIFLCFSFILLLPVLSCFFYPSEWFHAQWFLYTAGISFLLGYLLWSRYRKGSLQQRLTINEGAIIVVSCWFGAIVLSALPFVFAGLLNFTQAFSESTNGWTTGGFSIMDIPATPRIFLLWRSLMQFFGGAGFAIIMLSSIGGGISSGMYLAEGRLDNLIPNIKKSAKMILIIYFTYTGIGTVAYRIAGMGWFDAINHTLTAIATGGYSTRAGSIGEFQSVSIEVITMVLMSLGLTGFGIHYLLWQRDWRHLRRCAEPWIYLVILVVCVPVIMFSLFGSVYPTLSESLRHTTFQIISGLSSTGFVTTEVTQWTGFSLFLIIILMAFGGMMDSTAGGIKLFRVYVIFQIFLTNIQSFFLPKGTVKIKRIWKGNSQYVIDDPMIHRVSFFMVIYFITLMVGVGILMFHGYSFFDSVFEYVSIMSTVGFSSGITHPDAAPMVLWTLSFGLILGRLEFIVVIFGISKVLRDLKIYAAHRWHIRKH